MNKSIITLLILFIITPLFAQVDSHGNPVFNSISTSEKQIENFTLISNYYTLKNNIENKKSSVFISSSPSINQIEQAALNLPSDYFLVTKDNKMIAMIMLLNKPKREFMIVLTATNQSITAECNLKGDITQNRANELLSENFEKATKIEGNLLTFNSNKHQIISEKDIEIAVVELIKKEKLLFKQSSNVVIQSQNDMKNFVIVESKNGGKIDFFTVIKGKENEGIQIKPGVYDTKLGLALYKWGHACFDIGINKIEDVFNIFTEVKGLPITKKEKEYIKMGFNKELD